MYPPNSNQPPKMVRPRSSISTTSEELQKRRCSTLIHPTTTEKTLCGLIAILLTFCICLLGALVIVGKSLSADNNLIVFNYDNHFSKNNISFIKKDSDIINENEVIKQKPKVIYRPNQNFKISTNSPIELSNLSTVEDYKILANNISEKTIIMSKILQKLSFRLPREISPKNYQLFLHPNLKEKTFSGNVTIQLNILKPISYIPVHAKRLEITSTNIFKLSKDGQSQPIRSIQSYEYEPHEYWVTEFENDLDAGEYLIKLAFNGNLTDRIVGFYQSSYFDPIKNETRWIATSKFEPTFARQAFPCFDEPDMKATFKVTLVRPTGDNYSALSNMNVEDEIAEGDTTKVIFKESVKMSTYLACFIVSDFQYKSVNIDTKGIGKDFEMRVFATPAQLNKVDFALETGKKITEFYIQYFKIEYPLPKLDMVAIPDFVSGAMEHWGLVTFRETALLYDENISAASNKERVATVVAHELAHMWFGNLVTMKWWNDLWLNEGFASYITYKGVDAAYPEWKMLDLFTKSDMHAVLKLDGTLASHPIIQTVENPDQITELFDTITYQKGASIIRMLEDFVGPDKFQEAVTKYLNKFKYGNAVTDDLLTEIDSLGFNFDVKVIMQTWTEQMGLPVVQVTKINDKEYKITQKRFLANPEDENNVFNDSPFNYRWTIPITYFTSDNQTVERLWFKYSDSEETIKFDSPVKWFKLNKNQVGYYRVNYPIEEWKAITDALIADKDQFSISDRSHLLNDVFALADATQLPYDTALDLTNYLANEMEYAPWTIAAIKLISLKNMLIFTDINDEYLKYARNLIDKIYRELGWNIDSDHLKNLFRNNILNAACALDHKDCLTEVRREFDKWLSDPKNPPKPDVRNTVYYYGMKTGNEENWNKVWELFTNENDASEKLKLMNGLSAIQIPSKLKKFIDLAWDEKNVRSQDYFTCLQYIAQNPIGESIVWDYVRENWQKMIDRFGLNERYLGRMIPGITKNFITQTKLKEMERFFEEYPDAGAGTASRQEALENVKNNIKWMEQNKSKVEKWLKKQSN